MGPPFLAEVTRSGREIEEACLRTPIFSSWKKSSSPSGQIKETAKDNGSRIVPLTVTGSIFEAKLARQSQREGSRSDGAYLSSPTEWAEVSQFPNRQHYLGMSGAAAWTKPAENLSCLMVWEAHTVHLTTWDLSMLLCAVGTVSYPVCLSTFLEILS
ncbi:hypothetical protein Bbelb_137820 [Branchiostoma belcheri]|nr:hypothetical protein Bbelb_137820 [Branchiostoma belcheri]